MNKLVTVTFETENVKELLFELEEAEWHGVRTDLKIVGVKVKEEKTVYVSSTLVKVDGEWRKERKNREFIEAIPKL